MGKGAFFQVDAVRPMPCHHLPGEPRRLNVNKNRSKRKGESPFTTSQPGGVAVEEEDDDEEVVAIDVRKSFNMDVRGNLH